MSHLDWGKKQWLFNHAELEERIEQAISKEKIQESSGKVWKAITSENLNSLYKPMPRRMDAVTAEEKAIPNTDVPS